MSTREITLTARHVAIFDFDKTIISHDTGLEFIVFTLSESTLRAICALLIAPLALLFFATHKTRFISVSIFLWLATVAKPNRKVIRGRRDFIAKYLARNDVVLFESAVKKIRQHQQQNEQVIIVSGSSCWMIKKILAFYRLTNIDVIASKECRFLGGMVTREHCFASRKVLMLQKYIGNRETVYSCGYTDSFSDQWLMQLCQQVCLINPTTNHWLKYQKQFGDRLKVLKWT